MGIPGRQQAPALHAAPGRQFHNGEPFNADAVKFTFDRLLGAEGAKGPQKSNYDSIGEVKVVDENTVDFILKQPDPVLLTNWPATAP